MIILDKRKLFSKLPSVDEVLGDSKIVNIISEYPRDLVIEGIREAIDINRKSIINLKENVHDFDISIDELINQRKGVKLKTKKLIIALIFVAVILLLFILMIDIQNMELFITVAFIDLLVMIVSIGVSLFVDFHHRVIIIMKYISLMMIILINVLYMMCISGSGTAVFIKVDTLPIELILLSLVTGFLCGAS